MSAAVLIGLTLIVFIKKYTRKRMEREDQLYDKANDYQLEWLPSLDSANNPSKPAMRPIMNKSRAPNHSNPAPVAVALVFEDRATTLTDYQLRCSYPRFCLP